MFAGRSIVSSVLRRAVVSTSSSRSFIVPALSLIKNAYQPKIVTSIASRSFMTSGILSVSDDAADSAPKPRMQPARNTDGSRASLFIGNLDFSITEQALLDMCEGVLGPNIATRARVAVDRESGRSRGFAHIDFATQEHANQAAQDLAGVELLGRALRIDHAAKKEDSMNRANAPPITSQRPPIKRGNEFGPTFSIFLGNLSWDVTPELVEDMLNDVLGHGLFTQVRLALDRETGRQRGFGHVDFIDQETAIRAVKELDGLEVMGRQLRADHAVKKDALFSGNGRREKPDAW